MNKHFHFRKIYKAFFLAVVFSVVFFNNAFAAGKCPNNQIENKDGTKCICPSDAPYYNPYDKFCHYNDQGYEG